MEQTIALLKVALRQQALFIPDIQRPITPKKVGESTMTLVAELVNLGYHVSEELLSALEQTTAHIQDLVLDALSEAKGTGKNWTPLVKDWKTPTNESISDYIVTAFANFFADRQRETLPCGHFIPAGTFALERYNGCPFCGTPFIFEDLKLHHKGSKHTILKCWTTADANNFLASLLQSKTALDATQVDSLRTLMNIFPLPAVKPAMKETLMLVVDILLERNEQDKVQELLTSPNEVLRYLWYKHTGFLQIIAPKTIIQRHGNNNKHFNLIQDASATTRVFSKAKLELKYSRDYGRMVARWLNNMEQPVEKLCEEMHPKRGMWVRFIRALRFSEWSKRKGFENLRELMDVFYNKRYEVHAGLVQHYRLRKDAETIRLLKQRPGLFARSLFANMLWFGHKPILAAFEEIIESVPARLVLTLNMYAETYFDGSAMRTVKPLGGVAKSISPHKLLTAYSAAKIQQMKDGVQNLTLQLMQRRFAAVANSNKTIFIDPMLFKIPLAIGDRSESVQDLPVALQGTRFPIEGDTVRLFMQWGTGLPAQHLDMDLSCMIAYDNDAQMCNFNNKYPTGCSHSGDIRTIPDLVGTAEYIELDLKVLREAKANYVTFTCNAYSTGGISPNLVVGWMSSEKEMTITDAGVAYDPSCVQHQVRIVNELTKGLVFGILEIATNEIIWMEMPFQGQVVGQLDTKAVKGLLRKLESKLSIGILLRIKAAAQQLTEVAEETLADEAYTAIWARDAAAVTQLFID